MAATRISLDRQHVKSTTPRSLVYTDLSNEQIYLSPPSGGDFLLKWNNSASNLEWLNITSLPTANIYNTSGTITGTRVVSFNNRLSFLYDDTVVQTSGIFEDSITFNATDVSIGSSVINLTPSLAAFTVNDIATDVGSGVNISPNLAKLFAEHNTTGDNVSIELSDQNGVVSSTYSLFQGLKYMADYSANFTALSLVTKDYVDTAIGGAMTDLTFTGASSPVTLNSSTGTDVVFTAGTGISLSQITNDLTISTTITQYTDELAQDAVGTILVDTDTIDLTYNDGTPSITAAARLQMSITSDASGIKLVNDASTPGNEKYYGTDGTGVKGFFDLPTGVNIYNADGTLTGTRVLTGGTNALRFNFDDGAGITSDYIGGVNYQGWELQDTVADLTSVVSLSTTDLFINLSDNTSGEAITIQGTTANLDFYRLGTTGTQGMSFSGSGLVITDSDLLQGMKYAASYAAYFATNPRSIPDVGYVNSLISSMVTGSGTATRVAFWSGTSTLSSNANLYWDNTNSRLGIGTSSPGYTLSVTGTNLGAPDLIVDGGGIGINNNQRIFGKNNSGVYKPIFYVDTANGVKFRSAGVDINFADASDNLLMTLKEAGNFGIGTNSPASKLHTTSTAAGSGSDGLRVSQIDSTAGVTHTSRFLTQQLGSGIGRTLFYAASNTTGTTQGQFDILTENGGSYLASLGSNSTGTNNTFGLYTIAGSETIRLNTAGTSYFNSGSVVLGGVSGSSSKLNILSSDSSTSLWSRTGEILLQNTSGTNNTWCGLQINSTGGSNAGGITFQIYDQANAYATIRFATRGAVNGFASDVLRIHDGKVGIPAFTTAGNIVSHDISGYLTSITPASLAILTNYWTLLSGNVYRSTGSVGIGPNATTPISTLHIDKTTQTIGGTTPNGALVITGLSYGNYALELGTDGAAVPFIQSRNASTTTTYNLALNPSGGNVGIGTTSPTNKLDVVGSVSIGSGAPSAWTNATLNIVGATDTRSVRFGSSNYAIALQQPGDVNYLRFVKMDGSSNEIMRIQGNGNIGIGQTTPTATLHLKAGVAAASSGPLKFTVSGAVLQTTPESGVLEVGAADNRIYYTGVSASRNTIAYLTDITGSITGTSGQVAFFNSGTTITSESSDFTWDSSTNRLGIRTSGATAAIDIRGDSLGTTQTTTDGLALVNFTAAAAGAQQISPAIRWRGFGWKTNSTAASQSVEFRSYVVPVQGAAAPTGNLSFGSAINASWTNDQFIFTTAGQFAIGTTTPAVTSILDLTSTTLGVLLPRMTTTQKNAISSPANGLLLYDNTLNKLSVYESSAWKTLGNGIYTGSGSLSSGTTVTMGSNSLLFNGSSGTDISTDVTIAPGTNEISLNVADTSGVNNDIGEVYVNIGYAAIGAQSPSIPGGSSSFINFQSTSSSWVWGNHEIIMNGSGISITDAVSTGLVYTADYSSNILANNFSIPDIFTVRENAIENYSTITSTTSPVNLNGVPPDYLINQGSTQATFTFSLPASPVNGEVCKLTFANAVTTLTITAQGGITMLGTAPTTAAIGTQLEYKYYHTITSWIRVK